MVRCSKDRAKTRYDAECVNARQAVARIQAKEEAEARAAAEALSESKRAALRRTQAAAAEARRRAAEAQRLREEAEYLAQFGVLPPTEESATDPLAEGNVPTVVVPAAEAAASSADSDAGALPTDGADTAPVEPEPEQAATDLEAIRDELRRRNEEGGS